MKRKVLIAGTFGGFGEVGAPQPRVVGVEKEIRAEYSREESGAGNGVTMDLRSTGLTPI
jgi:hypothetical protein